MALLFSNTVTEAADWLTETTGELWTARRVLEEIVAHKDLLLEVVPPRDARFGIYRYDTKCPPEMGYERSGPFVRIGVAEPRLRFPLRDEFVVELLERGDAELFIAQIPASDDPNGRWVFHEPKSGPPMRVTLDMCRVSAAVARMLAAYRAVLRMPADGITRPTEERPKEVELNATKQKAPDAFASALRHLISEISRRAAKQGLPFDAREMPGRKADLQEVAEKFGEGFGCYTPRTFDDYLSGLVQFKKGAQPSDFYRRLFPELFQ